MSAITAEGHRCSACKEHKPAEAFSKNRATGCGLANQCKVCFNAGAQRRYGETDVMRNYNREGMRLRRAQGRAWLAAEAARRGGCVDYGNATPGWDGLCFDQWTEENYLFCEWDHLPQFKKKFELARSGFTIPALKDEAAKCEPVCHNHHLIRTIQRRVSE